MNRNGRFLRDNPVHQRIQAGGGTWFVLESDDPDAVVDEVLARGIRGLDVDRLDLSLLERLPDLEVLTVRNWHADIAPLSALHSLWYLAFPDGWKGRLDGGAWPRLEVFHPNDCPRDGGGLETLLREGSPLHDLHVGRLQRPDLTDLSVLRLENLSVWSSPKLTSLAGIEAHADTLQVLDFYALSSLASLVGVESLARLEVLRLDGISHVTTLEHVASIPRLRALDVFDLKGLESLAPLAGHPTLEYVSFGLTRDLDLGPLQTIPNLKWFLTGTYKWNRDLHTLPYAHDMGPDDPRRTEWNRLAHW